MTESKPVVLRSTANPTIRHLVRMRDNRARRRAQRVIVDGWRETAQALQAGLELCGVYLPESIAIQAEDHADSSLRHVLALAGAARALHWVSDSVMERIAYGQSHRGIVAEFVQPSLSLASLALPECPLVLILDQIEKPGNLGAIYRSADAAGIDAILLCDSHDLFNPNAIRSSLGSVFHIPSAAGNEQQLGQFLLEHGIRLVAARVESATPLWQSTLTGPLGIILGSEAWGLGTRWLSLGGVPIEGIRIPMLGRIDSLNVSVSAAVIAMEARRQRQQTG